MAKSILGEFKKTSDLKKLGFQNQIENIHYKKIRPARKNRGLRRIDELAQDIAEAGLENCITVRKIEDDEFDYEIIAGERRYTAICSLIEDGNMTYEYIPAKVENMPELQARKRLILNNYQNDPLTVAEKLDAIEELKFILQEEKKQGLVTGRLQDIIANELGLKKSQVGNYEKVINKAVPEVREKIADGSLTLVGAKELVDLEDEEQLMFVQENDDLSITSIKEYKQSKQSKQEDYSTDDPEPKKDEIEEIIVDDKKAPLTGTNEPDHEDNKQRSIKECLELINECYETLKTKITGVEWKEEEPALQNAINEFKKLQETLGI